MTILSYSMNVYQKETYGLGINNQVRCINCMAFKPDSIGQEGIGSCNWGIGSTMEINGAMPLYPGAKRHCSRFDKIKKD